MPEKQGKGKKVFKTVFAVIGSVLLMGAVYLAAVLIQSPVDGLAGSLP